MTDPNLAGMGIGFLLTVLILSYLFLDDNPLFRMGAHLLVGVSSGFLLAVMVRSVLIDKYFAPFAENAGQELWFSVILLVFLLLFVGKQITGSALWATIPMAVLVGVGAAVVAGGAITGTFLPQVVAAASPSLVPFDPAGNFDPVGFMENFFVLAGTVLSLAYFHFGAKPRGGAAPEQVRWVKPFAKAGAAFIAVTLGALYAGALLASLVALIERLYFLLATITMIMGVSL